MPSPRRWASPTRTSSWPVSRRPHGRSNGRANGSGGESSGSPEGERPRHRPGAVSAVLPTRCHRRRRRGRDRRRPAVVDQSLVLRVAAAAAHARIPDQPPGARRRCRRPSSTTRRDWNERTRQAMVSLLGAGSHLVASVEALERYDLFSRMVPEWRHVRSLPQRNAFHIYTVDRHLLQTVANAGEFVRNVSRPDLLLMGALLHDIGKGYPDRPHRGRRAARRPDGATHGILARGRRRDPFAGRASPAAARRRRRVAISSDPRTAANVAALVGDPLRLELLRALTEADSLATGPSAWSAWKALLIDELTRRGVRSFRRATRSRRRRLRPTTATASWSRRSASTASCTLVASPPAISTCG